MSIEFILIVVAIGLIYSVTHKVKVEAELKHAKEIAQRDLAAVEDRLHTYVTELHQRVGVVEAKVEATAKTEAAKL